MDGRIQKQLIIGLIFAIILGGIGYGIYNLVRVKPTCFDGIKNGQEEGIDCGILACGKACEPAIMPLQILSSKLIKTPAGLPGQGDYDFVAQISNSNTDYGAGQFTYDLVLLKSDTTTILTQSGASYVFPGQTKYLVLTSIKSSEDAADAKLIIKSAKWQKLNLADGSVNFTLRRKDYHPAGKGSELAAVLYNDSNFDFDKVDVTVILFDDSGNILDVNRTDINTFISKSERGFTVSWPFLVNGAVNRIEVEAITNLFENSNFIKSYGVPEKFQKFY